MQYFSFSCSLLTGSILEWLVFSTRDSTARVVYMYTLQSILLTAAFYTNKLNIVIASLDNSPLRQARILLLPTAFCRAHGISNKYLWYFTNLLTNLSVLSNTIYRAKTSSILFNRLMILYKMCIQSLKRYDVSEREGKCSEIPERFTFWGNQCNFNIEL